MDPLTCAKAWGASPCPPRDPEGGALCVWGRSKQVTLPYSSSIWLFMYVDDKSGALLEVYRRNMSVVVKK